MGYQKAREGEGGALLGVSLPPVEALNLKLRRYQGSNCQGSGAVLDQAIDEYICCCALALVKTNENANLIYHEIRILNDTHSNILS